MSDQQIQVTWLTGEKVLKPVEYTVTEKVTGPWWWRRREYWIECEFSRLGPFPSMRAANEMLFYAQS